MNDNVNSEPDFEASEAAVVQTVFMGRGSTLEAALANAAGNALRKHPPGTPFEISKTWGEIHNPRVSEYRVILTKSTPPL